MARMRREQDVEFMCERCEYPAVHWMVEGRFEADGSLMPTSVDDSGSDADCPGCGQRGRLADEDIVLADW